MTIADKIKATCTTLVVMTMGLGTVALVAVNRMDRIAEETQTNAMPGIYQIGKAQNASRDIRGRMQSYIMSGAQADKEQLDAQITNFNAKAREILKAYEKTIVRSTERQTFDRIVPALDRYMSAWEPVRALSRQSKAKEAFVRYQATVNPAFEDLQKVLTDAVDQSKSYADECGAAAAKASSSARLWIWSILLISIVTGVGLALYVIRGIKLALQRSVKELAEGADQVASAAGQIASASQAMAQGASQQAGSLEETSASTQEISSMTRQNAENSRTAADGMARAEQRVQEANRTLEDMIASMAQINESSQKISKIIKVIDEIAFQTNILALNAAVEAARAGEAGMGFAVVADEVRNLAQRSAQAAKDTASLIEESVSKSAEGSTKLNSVAEAIRGITEEATRVKTLVDEVTAASGEQSRGMEQISKAITEMEQVTQRNAASSEESASASEELTAQAQGVKDVVKQLRALVERTHAGEAAKETHAALSKVAAQTPSNSVRSKEVRSSVPIASPKTVVTARSTRSHTAEEEIPFDDSAFKEM